MEYENGDVFYSITAPDQQTTYTIFARSKIFGEEYIILKSSSGALRYVQISMLSIAFAMTDSCKRSKQFKTDMQELING